MQHILEYYQFRERVPRPTRKLEDLGKYRNFMGDRYRLELLPKFKHLNLKWGFLRLPEWFEKVQQMDDMFYTYVYSGEISQPDVRELWRDLTGRPESKLAHVLNPKMHVKTDL